MKYVNVTLDVGAAMNAFKTVWQYPIRFKNVIIHLGDCHFMKENFTVRRFHMGYDTSWTPPKNSIYLVICSTVLK